MVEQTAASTSAASAAEPFTDTADENTPVDEVIAAADQPDSESDDATDAPEAEALPGRRLKPALPEAKPAAQRRLADALTANGWDQAAADAVATAVEDPRALLEQMKAPAELGVHGGTIRYVVTKIRNGTVLPIPTNPRVAGEVHYAAGGSADGSAIEPLAVAGMPGGDAGLVITAASRSRLIQDMDIAAEHVRGNNTLADSIASQGVLLPTTLVPVRFEFADSEAPRTVLCTVDGSSRLTAAMDLWDLTSREVLFDLADTAKLKARIDAVRSKLDADERDLTDDDRARLRTRIIPAQLIVGWEAEEPTLDFPDILDAYLGLLHVEPPKRWGEAAEQDSRAEAVLDELLRIGRIDETKRSYLAGHLSPQDAEAAEFDASLDGRSAEIFYELDRRKNANAINRALRRIGMKTPARQHRLEVATELAMRPYRRSVPDLNRRNPRQALPAAMDSLRPDVAGWSVQTIGLEDLLTNALAELDHVDPRPNAAELAVRGAFWLTRYSSLQKSSRVDPRLANEVLGEMASSEHGLRCLHQAIVDGRAGSVPRQVRPDGTLVVTGGGANPEQTDRWLRETFPRTDDVEDGDDSSGEADEETETEIDPIVELRTKIYSLLHEASTLVRRVDDLKTVVDENGQVLIDRDGIPADVAQDISTYLDKARTEVTIHGATWRRTTDRSAG